jgi:Ca2+-binding EF-hand superfamily protein
MMLRMSLLGTALGTVLGLAQDPRVPGQGPQPRPPVRSPADQRHPPRNERKPNEPIWVLKLYSSADGRRAFTACDLNGDDDIVYTEAKKTIQDIKTIEDFRKFDQDGDGTVYCNEFNLRYRNLVQMGGTLTLTGPALTRELRPDPTAGRGSADQRALRVLHEVDVDRDGRISASEWGKLAALLGSAAEARKIFENLDEDQSRDLSLGELRDFAARVWLVQAPEPAPPPTEDEDAAPTPEPEATGNRLVRLRPEVAAADTDGDGVVSRKELTYALLRLDPRLEKFAGEILDTVDLNGDARIGPREAARIEYPRSER